MAYNEDSSASGHDEPWIQWFCGLKGHEMFCEVERSYIEDGFNLYGLRACVSNFSDCLDLILDRIGPDDSDDSHLTQSACTLYGLIHARYIITAHGLDAMYNKYAAKEFGTCPLVQCQCQPVLPVGLRDEVGYDSVKVFCPKCQCVYHPPPPRRGGSGTVDGASFGTTFAHLFLMTFSNLVPDSLPADSIYVPRVFGFRVHQSARQRPDRGGSAQLAASNNSRSGRNSGAVAAAAAAAAAAGGTLGSGTPSTAVAAAGGEVAGDGSRRQGTKGVQSQQLGEPDKDGCDDGNAAMVPASASLQQDGTVLTAAEALDGTAVGENSIDDGGGKVRCDEVGTQACGRAGDTGNGDVGAEKQGSVMSQTKRKTKGSSALPSSAQAENNGSVDGSYIKQSKRQKRPNNGIGT